MAEAAQNLDQKGLGAPVFQILLSSAYFAMVKEHMSKPRRNKFPLTIIIALIATFIAGGLIVFSLIWQSNTLISQNQDTRSDAASSDSPPAGGLKTKKYHPGHYLQGYPLDNPPGNIKKDISDDPRLQVARGVRVPISWKAIEPTKGNYNWKLIDEYLAAIGPNQQMFLHWWATDIWNKNCDSATRIPTYMLPDCTKMYSAAGVHGNAAVKWWEPGPRAEMIRVLKEIGKHYDNHPQFEGIMFDETTFGNPPTSDISNADFQKAKLQAYKEIHTAIAPYFAKSQVIQPMNWLGGSGCTELRELANHLQTLGHGISNPDSPPWKALPRGCGTAYTNAPEALSGDNTQSQWYSIAVYNIYREYKNKIPIAVGGDTSQFGNPLVSKPRTFNKVPMNMANLADLLYKQAVNGYTYTPTGEFVPGFGANYILWSRNFGNPSTPYTMETKNAFIAAYYPIISDPNRKTNTACPSSIKCDSASSASTPPPLSNPSPTATPSPTPVSTPTPTPTPASSANIIKNGGFSSVTYWHPGLGGKVVADNGAGKYTITDNKQYNQLLQRNLPLQTGKTYRVRFRARASTPRTISIGILKDVAPFTNYRVGGSSRNFDVTTTWRNFDLTFVAGNFTGTVNDARFRFVLNGAAKNTDFWFDDLVIEKL